MKREFFYTKSPDKDAFYEFIKQGVNENHFESLNSIKEKLSIDDKFGSEEFVFAICNEGKMFSLVANGASLFLVRDGRKIPLLRTLRGTSSVVSGKVQEGDLFVVEIENEKFSFPEGEDSQPTATIAQDNINISSEKTKLNHALAGTIDRLLDKLPERKIVIHGDDYKNSRARKASLVGIILLVILGISIYFGMNARRDKLAREEYEPRLLSAIHDYEEALELAPLSQSRARELILASRKVANELTNEGIVDERLSELSSNITSHLGSIAGIYDDKAEVFLDLSIVSNGFQGSDLAFSGGELRVLDATNRRLVGIEVANKRTNVISGPDYLPDAISTAAYADRSFILSSDGIREVTDEVSLVIKPDEWDANDILFTAFAGNIYVLDKGNDQIWRYQGVRGGFLEKEAWLGEGFTRDTSDAAFLEIDGSIWTLDKSGGFKVYSLGAPASFSITNETSPFLDISGFYTNEESRFIYVLDKGNSRVSIIEKSGLYVSEYIAPELADATDLVVDEESRLILFLANGKLYAINARHLENSNESE